MFNERHIYCVMFIERHIYCVMFIERHGYIYIYLECKSFEILLFLRGRDTEREINLFGGL